MASSLSNKLNLRVVHLAAGLLVISCVGIPHPTWAQETTESAALQNASESQVTEMWTQLRADSLQLEQTNPRSAIARYQQFFDQGAGRFPIVGVQIALHVAGMWRIDVGDRDQAIGVYEWALGTYSNDPKLTPYVQRLNAGYKAVLQSKGKSATGTDTAPAKNGATAPLTVTIPKANPGGLGVNVFPLGHAVKGPGPIAGSSLLMSQSDMTVRAVLPAPRGTALGWQPGADRCTTALAQANDGVIWVATEDSGVWRYNPAVPVATRWKQFTAKDGLGDDSAYALAVDQQGRVWAGTLNHGVSVWNGQKWQNYSVLDGPLGERVFDIKVCPTDGDVWIATNAGLTRYSIQKDSWNHITRAHGLPSDQIQSIAFDKRGNLVLGTQCDGLALAQASNDYTTWTVVTAQEQMPTVPTGKDLPSNLINDVLVDSNDTIYVATSLGLSWSKDHGTSWNYVRGRNYADKVRGLYGGAPVGWKEQPGAILAEDYVSCLAQDETGHIWLGHRQAGNEILQMQDGAKGLSVKTVSHRQESGFIRAILNRGIPLLARYDEGLSYVSTTTRQKRTTVIPTPETAIPLPSVSKAPTLRELNALLTSLSKIQPLAPSTLFVTPLADDWMTQGDWLGRYGRYWAALGGMVSPKNYLWGAGGRPVAHAFQISPKQQKDELRYWVSWLQTDNPRSLEMPPTYFDSRIQKKLTTSDKYRRQSEMDDHGEVYPLTKEGPDIYCSVNVPNGLWTLSFYNYNNDGREGMNRVRDYRYSVRSHDFLRPIDDISDFDAQPELAHSRQHDFAGGMYKKFLVRGPQQLTIRVARNNSFNTILEGVFLDLVDEQPAPYFGTVAWWRKRIEDRKQEVENLKGQTAPEHASRFAPALTSGDATRRLFLEIERLRDTNPLVWAQKGRLIYQVLARAYKPLSFQGEVNENTLFDKTDILNMKSSVFYNLSLYNDWELVQKQQGLTSARDIEKSLKWDGHSSDGEGFRVVNEQLRHSK